MGCIISNTISFSGYCIEDGNWKLYNSNNYCNFDITINIKDIETIRDYIFPELHLKSGKKLVILRYTSKYNYDRYYDTNKILYKCGITTYFNKIKPNILEFYGGELKNGDLVRFEDHYIIYIDFKDIESINLIDNKEYVQLITKTRIIFGILEYNKIKDKNSIYNILNYLIESKKYLIKTKMNSIQVIKYDYKLFEKRAITIIGSKYNNGICKDFLEIELQIDDIKLIESVQSVRMTYEISKPIFLTVILNSNEKYGVFSYKGEYCHKKIYDKLIIDCQ